MASGSSSFQAIPICSTPGPVGGWKTLLQDTLGKEEGAAVAASLARREVVVKIPTPSEDHRASGQDSKKQTCNQDVQKSGEPSGSEKV